MTMVRSAVPTACNNQAKCSVRLQLAEWQLRATFHQQHVEGFIAAEVSLTHYDWPQVAKRLIQSRRQGPEGSALAVSAPQSLRTQGLWSCTATPHSTSLMQ